MERFGFIMPHLNRLLQVVHTISICLAITLAVWRYIAICRPHLHLVLCTLPRSRIAVALAFSISFLITLPNFFMYAIAEDTRRWVNP